MTIEMPKITNMTPMTRVMRRWKGSSGLTSPPITRPCMKGRVRRRAHSPLPLISQPGRTRPATPSTETPVPRRTKETFMTESSATASAEVRGLGRVTPVTFQRRTSNPSSNILSVTPQEVAERQAGRLKYGNTDSDIDRPQQRGRDGEGEARVDASNDKEHGPADGRRWNHNSPPSAKYETHKQQRRNHISSVLRGHSTKRRDNAGARMAA
jgi:hypothetical protein